MAGPIDPRLLRRASATRRYLVAGVAVGSITAVLSLAQAWLLSTSIGEIFSHGRYDGLWLAALGLTAVFAGRAGLAWLHQWLAHRTSAAVKSQLRRDIISARLAHPIDSPASTGGLITLVTQGLDALDGYFSKYLPQLVLAVTVPFIIGFTILTSDLLSAVILAVTMPLIPVFMALVGWTTEARTQRRWAIQTRLAHHFADLVTGLPTLQVFGRAKAQAEGLKRTEAAHVRETMGTLRISFLSAMVLELLATLSVAVIAVVIGFRVVYGQLDLTTALFILILAPDAYLPIRQVGVHYHDSADGVAAAEAAFNLIDAHVAPADADAAPASGDLEPSPTALLSIRGLSHTYPGAAAPALLPTSFDIEPGELVALSGSSGGGKTTLLNAVLGFLTPTAGHLYSGGRPLADLPDWRTRVAYVGQFPGLIVGSVAENVRLADPDASDEAVRDALARAGAAELPLDQEIGDRAEGVSAGERRRIATARALLRIDSADVTGGRLLVLDEPTAGLDADAEAVLLASLREAGVGVLVVSHRPAVLAAADRVIELEVAATVAIIDPETTATTKPASDQASAATKATNEAAASAPALDEVAALPVDDRPLLRRLLDAVPGSRKWLALSIFLAFCASAASVALMSVSAWLLAFAALLVPVLFLEAPSVAVRFFGISRGVLRYVERLTGHNIALRLQSALRLETYTRLARTTLLGRRRGDLLTTVIADVEAIQDLVVRVLIPFVASALVIVVTGLSMGVISPGSGLVLLASAAFAGLLVPWLAQRLSARADAAMVGLRGELADSVHEIAEAAADLVAYNAAGSYTDKLLAIDDRLRRSEAHSTWVRGLAVAGQLLAAGAAVIGALLIGANEVANNALAPGVVGWMRDIVFIRIPDPPAAALQTTLLAVLVLTPLALHEALSTLVQSAQTYTRAKVALGRVEALLDADPVGAGDLPTAAEPVADPGLQLDGLAAGWPGHDPVVTGLSLDVERGQRVALVGPSGVGKTTVAATVLGLIPAMGGRVDVRGRVGYLAQDAHIFSTSIAENVRIGNRDATPEQVAAALTRAGLGLSPDRLVGETGTQLSGGEARRVALARLMVGDYQVLVLDEPTEHLDVETATHLIDDIWSGTSDAAVLVITHDPAVVARCDHVVNL